jgi:Zn-dependent protease with chaperone function
VGWFKWGIPKFAEQVAKRVPPAMAYDIGAGTLNTLDRIAFSPSLLLPEDQQRIRARFEAIAAADADLPLTLVFRHAGGPNAFALPDGTVVMTDELVYLADNDEQILSVVAHEVGHLHHRHALRMALESSTMALLISAYVGDAAQMSGIFASLPAVYTQAHYSRSHETEADTFALDYLQGRGIALHHFADILSKLEQKNGGGEHHEALDYWSSHPPTKERIARFR